MLKFKIETWGCQMNEYDSQKMSGLMKHAGYQETAEDRDADIVVLNTCSVREKAAHKLFSRLGMLRKRYGNNKILGVCGCVASQDARMVIQRAPYVRFVLGTRSTHLLPQALEAVLAGKRFVETGDHPENMDMEPALINREGQTKAFIAIMQGCDNYCTYCVVPYTRGHEFSRPLDDILTEARQAVQERGMVEIELLGQNVNSYKHGQYRFVDVLAGVSELAGVKRVRFLTSHPKDFDLELATLMAERENICNFLHLPIQSGADPVLKRMGRKYSRQEYLDKIRMVRELIPDIVLSSDFIVGFPGETDEDFERTMEVIHGVRYDNVFSFKYSPRPGTAALRLKDEPVPEDVASGRLERLQHAQEQIQLEKHQQMIGQQFRVLVESVSKRDQTRLTARTEGNHVVHFNAGRGASLVGQVVTVQVEEVTMASLAAVLV